MNWFHLLTVILLIAKLAGYTTMSYWLVFLPSIITVALGLLIFMFIMLIAVIKSN